MELSKTNPDFVSIVSQLSSELQARNSWKDILDSSTGETIIQFMAACTTMLYSEILRSVDELNISTARNRSSVYALANLLGVPVRRSVGGEVLVDFTIPSVSEQIMFYKYDSFTIDGISYFITQDLTIPAYTTLLQNITLRQGTVNTYNFVSSGSPFQQFIVGSNFTSDNKYVDVQVNNDPVFWTMTTDTLWQYGPSDKVFQVTSLPEGTIRILFGDGTSGQVPVNGVPIKIYEVSTLGKSSNQSISGLSVNPVTQPVVGGVPLTITGITTTSVSGGDDQESVDRLRFTTPRFFASGKRAITRNDWTAIGLKYPNVADIKVWGEYEEGLQLSMMNTVKISLLMDYGPAIASDQDSFDTYMSEFKHLTTRTVYQTPVPIYLSVNVTVYVKIGFSLTQVQSNVRSALEDNFKSQPGVLGKSIYVSDVNNVILAVPGVDYVSFSDVVKVTGLSLVKSPAVPTAVTSPGVISGTAFTSGGSVADGTYYYVVSTVDSNGTESAKSPEVSKVVSGGGGSGRVDLTWTAVTGASTYRIYRGTATGVHTIYYSSGTNSYSDTGGASTAGTPKTGTLAAATYYVGITSFKGSVESGVSVELAKVVPSANGSLTINWTAVSGATGYGIYIGTASGSLTKKFTNNIDTTLYYDGTGGSTVTDPSNGVIVDGTYYYVVVGVDAEGKELAKSDESSIVLSVTGAFNSVILTWTAVSGAVTYNVYRGTFTGGQNIKYSGITSTSFTDLGATGVIASPITIVPILKDPIILQRYEYIQLQPTPIITTISSSR